ncbi:MAG TPA: hypothetical protein PKH39_17780 [Woeseiaceae bacterium]|nr:hypothetical protein [Woeseiaceae bacterium]
MDARQFRIDVVRPALKAVELHSGDAEALVMGTAAQESHFEYVRQLGGGPALSFFQMEPATHDDIWENYLRFRPQISGLVRTAIDYGNEGRPSAERLLWDMRYSAIMCRLQYRRFPDLLPSEHDIWAMAALWKRRYNTQGGAGTEQEFVDNYRRVK